jgi:phage terminase large subunit-like protein
MSTVKGYKPHDNQRMIHDAINHGHEKYYALNIGRQFGKTMLGINQLLWWAINDKGCKIAWVTPVYKQGKKVFSEMERATSASGLFSFNRSDLMITGFGSSIEFFSGERPDNIRGNTFDYMVVDEMAFTRPELWDEVLSATVLVKGKKIIFISTPKGKNHFHRLCMQPNYDDRYVYFHFTSYDNPMIDPRELDERKRSLPDYVFRQEYLAEFIDNASGIFKNVHECIGEGAKTPKMYGGLDIGRADDYTVLTIINQDGQMVTAHRWRHDEWTKIIEKVATIIKQYNATTLVEVNNQGDVFFEMLSTRCKNMIHPFVTTSKTKPIIIEDLAVAFEQSAISIINEQWLIDELENFSYIYNPNTRSVTYSAPSGLHDDGVISTALAWNSRKEYANRGRYMALRV